MTNMRLAPNEPKELGLPANILGLDYSHDRTIVLIPSISFGGLTSQFLTGLNFFEERNLFYLACLSNPRTSLVAVLSDGIDDSFITYCIDHICSAFHLDRQYVAKRFDVIRVPTDGKQHLTKSILQDKETLRTLRAKLHGCRNPVIDFWVVSQADIRLAEALGLPYYGLPRDTLEFDNKSNARAIFRSLDIPVPQGFEDVASLRDAQYRLRDLCRTSDRDVFLLKLNSEEGGNGIAKVPRDAIALPHGAFIERISVAKNIPVSAFEKALGDQKATVEEFIEAPITACPSVKMEILPDGTVRNLATHDQILNGVAYAGSRFPAHESYRRDLIRLGHKIAEAVKVLGVRGLLSVDFLVTRENDDAPWNFWGIEMNARKGATTHSNYWCKWLTKANYDEEVGILNAKTGNLIYKASEYFISPELNKVQPEKILKALKEEGLNFNPKTNTGVFIHMISCVPRFGKLGATIIGHNESDIDKYWSGFTNLLERLPNQTSDNRQTEDSYQRLIS